jgi:hypothetical protein
MGMVFSHLLVVVDEFNVKSVSPFKTEYDTPVGPYRHGPETLQIAFKRVQAIPGNVESLRRRGRIENRQYPLNRIQQVGTYPATVVMLMESFQSSVLEAPNHQGTP